MTQNLRKMACCFSWPFSESSTKDP